MLMCRDLARVSSDYVDGHLGPVRQLSVRMHLLMCKDCRRFIGNLRQSVRLIQCHSDYRIDKGYAERLDQAIENKLKQTSTR